MPAKDAQALIEGLIASHGDQLRRFLFARVRNIAGMPEITWARLLQRRAEYEAWTDPRLVLDTSRTSPAQLLAQALNYVR